MGRLGGGTLLPLGCCLEKFYQILRKVYLTTSLFLAIGLSEPYIQGILEQLAFRPDILEADAVFCEADHRRLSVNKRRLWRI